MLSVGDTVPEFELPGTTGTDIELYRLSEYTQEGVVVLVFYPFDFSPVCTKELCEFRDAEWLTVTDNVDVFGISLDSCYAHQRFIQENNLSFPLLSDSTGEITDRFGVAYDTWEHHKGVPKPALITIDDTQTVRYTWITDSAYETPTLDELRQTIATLAT